MGRDMNTLHTFACEFIYAGDQLGVVVADMNHNLQVLQFLPKRFVCLIASWIICLMCHCIRLVSVDPHSFSGRRLMCVADFHVGSLVTFAERVLVDVLTLRSGTLLSFVFIPLLFILSTSSYHLDAS